MSQPPLTKNQSTVYQMQFIVIKRKSNGGESALYTFGKLRCGCNNTNLCSLLDNRTGKCSLMLLR